MKFFRYVLSSVFFTAVATTQIYAQQRPNILVIISDDHAYQTISAYGSQYASTPAIDELASEGAIFEKAYVTNSICGPARAVFLSGKYSHLNGFRDNENSNFNFNQDIFVKRLQHAGYNTAWIGKMHLGNNEPQGFNYYQILPGQGDYYNPVFIEPGGNRKKYDGYVTNIVTDLAEGWLDTVKKDQPFCLVVGHKATHRTWMPDLQDLDRFEDKTFPLPADFYDNYATRKAASVQDMTIAKTLIMGYDLKMFESDSLAKKEGNIARMTPGQQAVFLAHYRKIYDDFKSQNLSADALTEWKFQRYMRDYLATAVSLDRNIGRLLDYLDQKDLSKNTLVIYLSDQGFYMGEHGWFDKRFMYEESFRTPVVMRYPGVVQPGSHIKDFIMNLDLAPTLLDVAGVPVPPEMQGESFLPLLKKEEYPSRDAIYYHYYENGEHAVSPHFGVKTRRYKLIRFYKRVEEWELFDLQEDPRELKNIYHTERGKKLAPDLKKVLMAMIHKYKDTDAEKIVGKMQ